MKKYTFLILLLFLISSCSDFLDLEPETSLSSAVAFDTIEGIEAGINGAYSTIHSDWVERQYIFAECLASNVKEVNTLTNSNYTKALNHADWTDLFNISNYFWEMSYRCLDLSNQIINALPNIEETNGQITADKERLSGEAHFLRGLMFFVLNRYFGEPRSGLSVPILTKPFEPEDAPARASIEETKAQVIADLEEAENLLANIESNNGRATIWSVRGLLARVYFEYKDYENAESYANMVIESGKFSLMDGEVAATFGTNVTSENIFTFLSIPNDRAADRLYERYALAGGNVQLSVSDSYWSLISQNGNDLRLSVLHEDFGTARACHKYNERDMNIPYIRLPEMYFIRAESRVNNGNLDAGLADLNRLRQRAGLDATDYSNKADLLDKIYTERSLEFSMEGDNFHNLKRLEQSIGGYPWEEARYKLVFFIPEKEVQLNPNLIQNDTW